MGGPGVIREMDERAIKETNLVFHKVWEARGDVARKRIDEDRTQTW